MSSAPFRIPDIDQDWIEGRSRSACIDLVSPIVAFATGKPNETK
jgi:hypothetical protein